MSRVCWEVSRVGFWMGLGRDWWMGLIGRRKLRRKWKR